MCTDKSKAEMAKMVEKLTTENLIQGTCGNISARCEDGIIINKKGRMDRPEDYVVIDINGKAEEPTDRSPSSMTPVHCSIYKARTDIKAIIHWRGIYTDIIVGFMDELPATNEVMFQIASEVPVIKLDLLKTADDVKELAEKEAEIVVEKLKQHNSVIVPFLGTWTVGRDLEYAYLNAKVIENTARTVVFKKLLCLLDPQLKIEIEAPPWLVEMAQKYKARK